MLFSFHENLSASSSLLLHSGFFHWIQYREKEQSRLIKKTQKGKIGKIHEKQQLMMVVKERQKAYPCKRKRKAEK